MSEVPQRQGSNVAKKLVTQKIEAGGLAVEAKLLMGSTLRTIFQ